MAVRMIVDITELPESGNFSVGVTVPKPADEKDLALMPTGNEKVLADYLYNLIGHSVANYMKIHDGGEYNEKKMLEVRENPLPFIEVLVSKIKHTKMDWIEVNGLLAVELSGKTFRELTKEEIDNVGK